MYRANGKAGRSDKETSVIFNFIILVASILTILFITIAWRILDFSVISSYILSTIVSLLVFYQLKLGLLKENSPSTEDSIEVQSSLGSRRRQTILLFVFIALILATPLIILIFIPRLWVIVLDGIVTGATMSELVLYFQKK